MVEQSIKWEEFADVVRDLKIAHDSAAADREPVLFRGQPDAAWDLKTSLERYSSTSWTPATYAGKIVACLPKLETLLDKSLDAECRNASAIIEKVKSHTSDWIPPLPDCALWVYMRHHGFPSPLLDWTESPFVAAFFAFDECQAAAEEVAVFAYWGRTTDSSSGGVDTPHLTRIGKHIRSDVRHFSQQCSYTVATKYEGGRHVFTPHSSAAQNMDKVMKLKLPAKDRITALRDLMQYSNITRYTLFHTVDDLVRTLAFEELVLGA
jgi:hypothetical protein